LGETPVLIPNTMVKTLAADGTMLVTAWESRWLPESFKKQICAGRVFIDAGLTSDQTLESEDSSA
jgi:hypothetical protein